MIYKSGAAFRRALETRLLAKSKNEGIALQFRRLATNVGMAEMTLAQAADALERFVEPALSNADDKTWNPASWSWE